MTNLMRFILIVCIIFSNTIFCSAEIVYLQDGSIIKGKILSQDENNITLRTSFGEIRINKADIKSISFSEEIGSTSKSDKDISKSTNNYDASNIYIDDIKSQSGDAIFLFNMKFISVEYSNKTIIRAFIIDREGLFADIVQNVKYPHLTMPQIVDEIGNKYEATGVLGYEKITKDKNEKNVFVFRLPFKGRMPVAFEFPNIPDKTKTIWFNINNKSIEIDWQNILKNKIKQ